MSRTAISLIALAIAATVLVACDKAPSGVIKESDMAHVLADFAVAEEMMNQYPNLFPDDSSKLVLKQSILEKYDADLAKYDASLIWYAHNLKVYNQVHEKAIKILEKEGGFHNQDKTGGVAWMGENNPVMTGMGGEKRVFPNSGDSANVWTEPQQWVLTSAMRKGYITFDYTPDKEARNGDLYSLNMKMVSNNSTIKLLLAIDYNDGCTGYINRTATVYGWSNYNLQTDSTRKVKRIYGFIQYDIKPRGITFIDSIYLLRTHLDREKYSMIGVQRLAASKAIREREEQLRQQQDSQAPATDSPTVPAQLPGQGAITLPRDTQFPGRSNISRPEASGNQQFQQVPKRGHNNGNTPRPIPNNAPMLRRGNSPGGDHVPRPPIK